MTLGIQVTHPHIVRHGLALMGVCWGNLLVP